MTTAARPRAAIDVVKAYVGLTKPRIIELLLVTTAPTMVVAAGGLPEPGLLAATLIGGALAAGSANTINSYADRDLDEQMQRTAHRPLARGTVHPVHALRFGLVLAAAAVVWLSVTVNRLSAALALGAILFYVFVYTLGLKRHSAQNIVIGGAAGCVPVLVGWAAVTGGLEPPAFVLFAIVFAWTPPHFWALALKYRDDYARAGVPMLPVVRGPAETGRQILWYSLALVAVSLLFGVVAGTGNLYWAAAIVLGARFVQHAVRVCRDPAEAVAMRLFRFSIAYLGLLFVAMAVDAVVAR
jgi:protoheme IX farnesyltransferase